MSHWLPSPLPQHPDRLGSAWHTGTASQTRRGGGGGDLPALSAQLLSVPGSGAARLDANETSRLLEHALRAVDTLSRQLNDVAGENEALGAALDAARRKLAQPPPNNAAAFISPFVYGGATAVFNGELARGMDCTWFNGGSSGGYLLE